MTVYSDGCLANASKGNIATAMVMQAEFLHFLGGGLMSKIPGTEANKEAKMERGTGGGYGQEGYGQGNKAHLMMAVTSAFRCLLPVFLYIHKAFIC